MADFTLPSGRIIQTHEPTFGELIHVVSQGADNVEELLHAKFAIIVPGLTRGEIEALSREDGFALLAEVSTIWDGRSEEEQIPLGDGSMLSSAVSSPKITLKPRPDLLNTEWQAWRDAWTGHLKSYQPPGLTQDSSVNGSAGEALAATLG